MTTVKIRAQHLSSRLRLKSIASGMSETALSESAIELVYKLNEDSYVFIFHFGSLVFINVSEEK